MTTTKPPVLTDEEKRAEFEAWLLAEQGLTVDWQPARNCYRQFGAHLAWKAWQAVLERAGADAMRDAALVRLMPEVLASLKYHGQDVSLVADIESALKGTPAAAVADTMPSWSHWETRIKALMQDMGMPNSHSAYQALAQLANEMGQAHAASVAGQLSGHALNSTPAAAATPTNQQISDYLHGLDAVKRQLIEREAGQLSGNAGELDTARLDFLDRMNATLNAHYGTNYRWKLVLSHNITRLMVGKHWGGYVGDVDLNDANHDGLSSCRDAIDAAIAASKGASNADR